MITDFKINAFQKPIASLADAPALSAPELKEYFDSSPEELKNALNGTIAELCSTQGAKNVGFMRSDSVHADTVQEAIENVQGQIKNIALGQIPEGSVDETRLAQAVLDRMSAEENTRAEKDAEIKESTAARMDEMQMVLDSKCRIVVGKYQGNRAELRHIYLGFKPKAVLLVTDNGAVTTYPEIFGGLALQNAPLQFNSLQALVLTDTGFNVSFGDVHSLSVKIRTNDGRWYYYIAFE